MNMENLNTRESCQHLTAQLCDHLSALEGAPSVQMQQAPPSWATADHDDDKDDPDKQATGINKHGALPRQHPAELYDDDRDQDQQPMAASSAAMDADVRAPAAAAPMSSAMSAPPSAPDGGAAAAAAAAAEGAAAAAAAAAPAAGAAAAAEPPAPPQDMDMS